MDKGFMNVPCLAFFHGSEGRIAFLLALFTPESQYKF